MTSPGQQPSLTKTIARQVFPEPTVGALIVNKEGKILLARSHKWFDKYTLPGGHIEVGESMIKKKHFIFIDFYCKSKDQEVKLDRDEIQDYIWVFPGAAYNLKLDSFTRKTLDRYLERGRGSSSSSAL